ncbi:MAG: Gfo/Idh/MocA family oxidoreductase [Armatimonadetes bacterium]|nr:Gfo/Idh/MocA family oxidoreductase [Armatimonadota bacterium]
MASEASRVKVGIVGYGYAGRAFHSYLVGLADGLELAAISTRDSERRAQAETQQGVRTYEQPSELFNNPDIDLIVLATPHSTHRDLTVEALDAGKHVVVDKVMALTVRECDDMIAAAERTGKLLSVFHNRRWDGDYLTVKQAIESGILGRPLNIEGGIYGYGTPRSWRGIREQMGGILYDWGAHLVDQALLLGGSPVEWVQAVSQFEHPETDIESWARCQIRFRNGLMYAVEITNRARLGKPRWYVMGEKGTLVKEGLDPQEAAMNRKEIEKARWPEEHRARVQTEIEGMVMNLTLDTIPGDWRKFYQNIADVLLKGEELAVKPEQVRRAVAVLEAARRSADTGRRIEFGEDGLPKE